MQDDWVEALTRTSDEISRSLGYNPKV
jgi:hypothetical protein